METSKKYNRLEKLEAIRGFSALYVMLSRAAAKDTSIWNKCGLSFSFWVRSGYFIFCFKWICNQVFLGKIRR